MTYNVPSNWIGSRSPVADAPRVSKPRRGGAVKGDKQEAFFVTCDVLRLMGRKAELVDVEGDLDFYNAALVYLEMYREDISTGKRQSFDYLDQMCAAEQRWHNLSWGQVKGIINCLRADMVRTDERVNNPAPAPVASEPLTDGMYRTSDGTIYKLQYNKATGDGRHLYAKQLVIEDEDKWSFNGTRETVKTFRFEYAQGAMRNLTVANKMTLEQAKEFGALYGTCCVCGRTLTDETSIAEGIGPICAARF